MFALVFMGLMSESYASDTEKETEDTFCQLDLKKFPVPPKSLVYYCWSGELQIPTDDQNTDKVIEVKKLLESKKAELESIKGIVYVDQSAFFHQIVSTLEPDAKTILNKLSNLFKTSQIEKATLEQFTKYSRIDLGNKPLNTLNTTGNGCGCSSDFSSLVYGFYPYWFASKEVEAQKINYSLLDRIGFYSLSIDETAKINNYRQWGKTRNKAGPGAFIKEAHRHRVDVDLTFETQNWKKWSNATIAKASLKIVDIANEKFQYKISTGWKSYVPLLNKYSNLTIDGVTLFFNDYQSAEESERIVKIVTAVKKALVEQNSDMTLNIMLDININKIDKSLFSNLKEILFISGKSLPIVNNIFIPLGKDTSSEKKILRKIIEDSFVSAVRKGIMRKIVPIIHSTPEGEEQLVQFEGDIIYFQNNFKGIGLWPAPLATDSSAEAEAIHEKFNRLLWVEKGDNGVGKLINKNFPEVCQFICPNRKLFNFVFSLVVITLGVFILLVVWNCKIRYFYQRHILLFYLGGTILAGLYLLTLVCDPMRKEMSNTILLVTLFLFVAGFITRSWLKMIRPPLP